MMLAGLCLSDPHPDYASDGSNIRTISASHFAGRYRLSDFMLSNMVNSGIFNIGIIVNSHYQSMIAHIGMGKEWDLARKSGGVTFFPPYMTDVRQSVNNELEGPLQRATRYLTRTRAEYVVLADSSVIYNMDYRRAYDYHKKQEADITAIYAKKHVSFDSREKTIVFDITEDGVIREISKASPSPDMQNVSLGAFIMRKNIFLQMAATEKNCGMLLFAGEILPAALNRFRTIAYEYNGYSAQISSLETFFAHNMEMLDPEKRNALFEYENRRIFTSRRDSLPTKYGKAAVIKNSIVADGCQIDGTVENCVVFRNVRILPGAVVKNSILMENTVIGRNSELDWIVTDRSVIVSDNRNMIGYRTYPVYIGHERII